MNIIVIDISHNSSWLKVSSFLSLHKDADIIYTFDFQYYKYLAIKDLRDDINNYSEDFFTKPCAYYDMVTTILSRIWSFDVESVTVFSPEIDECSRFSNELRFNNLIRHYNILFPDVLRISYTVSGAIKQNTGFYSQLKNKLLSFGNIFKFDDSYDEYDEPSCIDGYDDQLFSDDASIIELFKALHK